MFGCSLLLKLNDPCHLSFCGYSLNTFTAPIAPETFLRAEPIVKPCTQGNNTHGIPHGILLFVFSFHLLHNSVCVLGCKSNCFKACTCPTTPAPFTTSPLMPRKTLNPPSQWVSLTWKEVATRPAIMTWCWSHLSSWPPKLCSSTGWVCGEWVGSIACSCPCFASSVLSMWHTARCFVLVSISGFR